MAAQRATPDFRFLAFLATECHVVSPLRGGRGHAPRHVEGGEPGTGRSGAPRRTGDGWPGTQDGSGSRTRVGVEGIEDELRAPVRCRAWSGSRRPSSGPRRRATRPPLSSWRTTTPLRGGGAAARGGPARPGAVSLARRCRSSGGPPSGAPCSAQPPPGHRCARVRAPASARAGTGDRAPRPWLPQMRAARNKAHPSGTRRFATQLDHGPSL